MIGDPLGEVLILLVAAVLVVVRESQTPANSRGPAQGRASGPPERQHKGEETK